VTNWAFEMTLKMGDIVIARFTKFFDLAERSTWSSLPNRYD